MIENFLTKSLDTVQVFRYDRNMKSIIAIQTEYIATRRAIDAKGTFGLARTMAVQAAREQMRRELLPFVTGPNAGQSLEQMIGDAIDMYELEAVAAGDRDPKPHCAKCEAAIRPLGLWSVACNCASYDPKHDNLASPSFDQWAITSTQIETMIQRAW